MDTERTAAALSIRTAADLLNSAAVLVELEDDQAAARFLSAVRDALTAAAPARDWEQFAQVLDVAFAPLLGTAAHHAPGIEEGVERLQDALPAEWSDVDYLAHGEESPDLSPFKKRAGGNDQDADAKLN